MAKLFIYEFIIGSFAKSSQYVHIYWELATFVRKLFAAASCVKKYV